MDFHARLAEGFRQRARQEPDRFCIINAAQDIDTIAQEILSHVLSKLGMTVT
jgi:thymidylate kinase